MELGASSIVDRCLEHIPAIATAPCSSKRPRTVAAGVFVVATTTSERCANYLML
jgi:hypothetical protein